jgi:hypothetical protein
MLVKWGRGLEQCSDSVAPSGSNSDLSDEALLTRPSYRWRVAKSEAANQDSRLLKNVRLIALIQRSGQPAP